MDVMMPTLRGRPAKAKRKPWSKMLYIRRALDLNLTQYAYANLIENYIVPHLGNITVKNVSPAMIAGMTQKIRTGTGHATARRTHELLCRALKQAYIWELIDRNPCERLSVPVEKNRVAVILELDEIKRLLDVSKAESYFYTVFLLTLTLGLRISEVRALKWTDIKSAWGIGKGTTVGAGRFEVSCA